MLRKSAAVSPTVVDIILINQKISVISGTLLAKLMVGLAVECVIIKPVSWNEYVQYSTAFLVMT